jgi:hypothetical protein
MGRGYEGTGAILAGVALAEEMGLVATAIRGRLNLGAKTDDPRASFEFTDAALGSARRYGLRTLARIAVGNLAGACLQIGEWDRAIDELTSTRDETTDTLALNYLDWALLNFTAWRGEDLRDEVARLIAWARTFDDAAALQAVHDVEAQVAMASGDLLGACDHWMAFGNIDATNAPMSYQMATFAALIGGDVERADAALAAHIGTERNGRIPALDRRLLAAGLLGLRGRPGDALREGRLVLGEYERSRIPWRHALGALMLVTVVDSDEAETADLAEAARTTFAQVGAKPFLALLDAALASRPGRAARPIRATQLGTRDVTVEAS